MARPRRDGDESRAARHRKLTELMVQRTRPEATAFNTWDTQQRGLVLRIQPSGQRSFKAVYRSHGRPRWYHIGDARSIPLSDARRLAARVMLAAAEGKDPAAERRAERGAGTFDELCERFLNEHAKKKNKSWQQGDRLVRRYLLRRWAKLDAKLISRDDVRKAIASIEAPMLANQVLAHASARFSWAVKHDIVAVNPCTGVERNETRSRERILSDGEVSKFWSAFDGAGLTRSAALKTILLTGQRPGEVGCMRREHIVDGWWKMPGEPDLDLGWPGTKNKQSHDVWLSKPVLKIIAELDDERAGFVFAGDRGAPARDLDDAMRDICRDLGIDKKRKVTPHDLRRTFSSKVTALGFGRDAMNRVTNHREGGIADVYDRHRYADENRRIMESVAAHIEALAAVRRGEGNVVRLKS
jgi:integrase